MPEAEGNPLGALRWLDRNAHLIKAGMNPVWQEEFDKAMNALWEHVLLGKGN